MLIRVVVVTSWTDLWRGPDQKLRSKFDGDDEMSMG